DWLNYRLVPALNLGLGLGAGYVEVDQGADMTYEQIQGRTAFRIAKKLELTIDAGVDIRQFLGEDIPDRLRPIFGVRLQYHPLEQTWISLHSGRVFSASYTPGELVESTEVGLTIRQRFLGKLQFELEPGYRFSEYIRTTAVSSENQREDD